MSKGLQLPWSSICPSTVYLAGYRLDVWKGYADVQLTYSITGPDGEERLAGTAPTLELAQAGAEDALKRYLDREGDDIYLAKCNKMLDERLKEKRFVNGKIIE